MAEQDRTESRLARYVAFDKANRPYLEWQVAQFREYVGERVLEIGCGVGSIIELLGNRELIVGADIESEVLEFARQRFGGRVRFAQIDAGAMTAGTVDDLRELAIDTVVCINVLEHIENDVAALEAMRSILRPGGHLALLVPAHQALYGAYDALDGHFRRYSKGAVVGLLRRAGFDVVKARYFNAVGAIGWWVQYKLLRRKIHEEGHFGVMNALVPLLRPLERAVEPPFGLSVVAIGCVS
jgi:2-polyprenyl-3-methyl-5-hydroxy-6-metoxy-1,4-benzoquinol methylase